MMKQSIAKKILFSCMFACLINSAAHAGIVDWLKRKKQQAIEGVKNKIDEARQTTNDLLKTLRENNKCLLSGDCSPEQKQKLLSIAKKVGVTIGVLLVVAAAIGISAKVMQDGQTQEELVISQPGEFTVVSRVDIAKKHGVNIEMGEKDPSLFMQAVDNRVLNSVKEFANRVKQNVIYAGIELAQVRKHIDIQKYLEALRDVNALFLQKVQAGVLEKVKEVYCDLSPQPSKGAIAEGMEIAKQKAKQYSKEVYQKVFQPIVNFLRNPQCELR